MGTEWPLAGAANRSTARETPFIGDSVFFVTSVATISVLCGGALGRRTSA
jgi:hypothetical protein